MYIHDETIDLYKYNIHLKMLSAYILLVQTVEIFLNVITLEPFVKKHLLYRYLRCFHSSMYHSMERGNNIS
jgi:hypothetical protein